MWKALRTIAAAALLLISGAFTTAKVITDLVGRSTFVEDAEALGPKLAKMFEWLADQPALIFYIVPLVLAAVAVALLLLPRMRQWGATPRPDTRLRLEIDPAGTWNYHQLKAENILRWQQFVYSIGGRKKKNGPKEILFHADVISLTFENDIEFERPIISSFGHVLGGYSFYPLGQKGAMFCFVGAIQAPVIEIWFPPLGYYAQRQAIEGDATAAETRTKP